MRCKGIVIFMKYIHIFLASSITELQKERTELSSYFRLLNDRFIEKGIYFRLHMCEDISDAISMTRKQDEYNEIIRSSDYFYVVFWKKVGDYTKEEFETALDKFRKSGAPKIVTFFKEVEGDVPEEVMSFLDYLDRELQHFYTKFQSIDSVKLKILLEMVKMPEIAGKVELKDAGLFVDGDEITEINLDNIPFYAKHEKLQALRRDVEALDAQFADAKRASRLDPDNDELWQRCYDISTKRNTALKALHDIEMQLIEMSARLTELSSTGEFINQRTRLAIELFEKGDLKGAKEVLDEAEYENDKARAKAKSDEMKKELQALVKERTVKIDIIKADGVTDESADEIEAIYDDITELFFEFRLSGKAVLDYIKFLWKQRNVKKAVEVAEKLYSYYQIYAERDSYEWSQINNRLGVLRSETQRSAEAVSLFVEAIRAQEKIARTGDHDSLGELAMTYNNLAVEYSRLHRNAESEEMYRKSIGIRREIVAQGDDSDVNNLAMSLSNYAILLRRLERNSEAEPLYRESLELRRGLVKRDRSKYLYDFSTICHNFAMFYSLTETKPEEAERLYREAIELRREGAATNPDAYVGALATSLSAVGSFYRRRERFEESEAAFKESLGYRRALAEQDFITNASGLVNCISTLSFLYEDMDRLDEALALSKEGLEIRKKIYEINPVVNEPHLAREHYLLGCIYEKMKQYDATLENYLICYNMRVELCKKYPDNAGFKDDLSSILDFLAWLYDDMGREADAEACRRESAALTAGA